MSAAAIEPVSVLLGGIVTPAGLQWRRHRLQNLLKICLVLVVHTNGSQWVGFC